MAIFIFRKFIHAIQPCLHAPTPNHASKAVIWGIDVFFGMAHGEYCYHIIPNSFYVQQFTELNVWQLKSMSIVRFTSKY